MNILTARKNGASNELNQFWNLSDSLNGGAEEFSTIRPDSGVKNSI